LFPFVPFVPFPLPVGTANLAVCVASTPIGTPRVTLIGFAALNDGKVDTPDAIGINDDTPDTIGSNDDAPPLKSALRHHTLLMPTGVVLISAGFVAENTAEPVSFPSASLKAWHEMDAIGREDEEVRARPHTAGRSE
jgi:hypothetical protein